MYTLLAETNTEYIYARNNITVSNWLVKTTLNTDVNKIISICL